MTVHVNNVIHTANTSKVVGKISPLLKYLAVGCALTAFVFFVISSPFSEKNHHRNYVENLQTLDRLSSLLIQDYLLVRHNQVRHYDFLETDLQNMEMSAQLSAIVPNYVGVKVDGAIQRLGNDYLNQLESIRNYVELSKRSIGLLRNSNVLLTNLTAQLTGELTEDANTPIRREKVAITIDLIYAVNDDIDPVRIEKLINDLSAIDEVSTDLLHQIRLHTDMVTSYRELLQEADTYILEHANALNQPRKISEIYRDEHAAILDRNAKLFATSLFLGVMSLMLFGTYAYKGRYNVRNNADKMAPLNVSANDDRHGSDKAA